MEGVDMNCLTETERDAILSVIRRNDQLQQTEQQRISKLQSEVKFIRLKGVIKPGQDAAKSCARCRTPFGWFFNTGTICPQCLHRVCDTCRVSQEQDGKWLCVLCNKQMQLKAMTGDWFYSKFRKSKRHKRTNKVITGSEIVRTSIHRPNRPNRLTSCNTAATGAANSIGQEVKRALSNNNASPKSQQPPNMCVDGESSDTQSMEDSYSPRRQLQKDLEGAAYPKDSDRQKLLNLIRPKMPDSEFANARNATSARPQVRVEVKQVSSNRYCDSDSSSDSETTNPSPPPFSRANDSFLTSESVRSSFRSTVSAISSEGPNTVVTEGISDLDIPTCSSASVSPTVFRKDVTAPNYHKDTQNERQYNSDKSRSNPSSSFTDGSGLLGISPTQARSEIDDEKQPKQVARRSLTKQDSLVDSSDSEGEFTTEQITRMKFRRISVSKTEAVKTSSPKDQNSREVAPSTKPPDSPPQPEVIITDHDPSPALELTDPEPAPTPELSHPPDTVTPCVEVEPQTTSVEPRELEPEAELSTNKTEEGAESLSGQQGGETGGMHKGGDGDMSPPNPSFLQHGGGGIASGSILETSLTNFTPTGVPGGGNSTGSKAPRGEGLVTRKEPLIACPADTNPALQTNNEKDSDRALSPTANSPLSANVSSVRTKHSGSCEVRGEGDAPALIVSSEHKNAESSESAKCVDSTRERVDALLVRLGRKMGYNEGNGVDGKANEVFDDDTSSESSFDDIAASNADFDDLEWDSVMAPRQGQITELEATDTNVVLMRELRTTGPIQLGLHEFDHDTDVNLCRSAYKLADTHSDLLDDDDGYEDGQQVASYYVCVNDDDLAAGGYSSSRLDPNLLNVNQDSYSDRLSIISELTEPQECDTDDGDWESDEWVDVSSSSLNTTVIMRSTQEDEPPGELDKSTPGASSLVTRDSKTTPAKPEKTDTINPLFDEAGIADLSKITERNKDARVLSGEGNFQVKKDKTHDKPEQLFDVTGATDSGNRNQHLGSIKPSQVAEDKVKNKSDEVHVKETVQMNVSSEATAVVSEANTSRDARQNQQGKVSQERDERKRPFPLVKQDTLSRLAMEAESNDTDDVLDLSLMVESNAAYAGDDEFPVLEKSAAQREDTVDSTKQMVDASKKTQITATNDKTVNKMPPAEVVVKKEDTKVKSPPVLVTKEDAKLKSPGVETLAEVQPQKAERPEPVSTQMPDATRPMSGETSQSSRSHSLLLRRDTITTMALEAIVDGTGDGDDDLASVFLQNKQYVTDTEVANIMSEAMVDTKDTGVTKTTEKPHPPKDTTRVTTSTPRKVQKSGGASRTKQMSDLKPNTRTPSKGGRDEAVDSSHALTMSQLMKVFNQPQKFMVPKVAEAYCQKEADLCRDEETDGQTVSHKEEFQAQALQESQQSLVDRSSHMEPQPGTVTASVKLVEESGHVKQERRVASVISAEACGHVEKENTVASVVSAQESGHVKQERTVASAMSSEESRHVKQERTVASVGESDHVKKERSVASVMLVGESEHIKQERTSSKSQVKAKYNNQDSRQPHVELHENNFVDVKYVDPKADDRELDLHVSFHELEAESSTDGTVKDIGKYGDDSVSSEEDASSNLETELKSRFGVLDEESVTDDITSGDNHVKVLLRVPSIVVTLADGTTTEDWVEEITPAESIMDASDAAKETGPSVAQPTGYTDASFVSVLQGIMLDDDKDSGSDVEEAAHAETEYHDVAVMENVETLQGDAGNYIDKDNDAVMGNVEEAQEEDIKEEAYNVAVMKEVEETVRVNSDVEKKNVTTNGSETETVNVAKIEEYDDETTVDNTDTEQWNYTASIEVNENIVSADGQLKHSPLILADEKESTRDSEEAGTTENEKDDVAERIAKIAEDENQNVAEVEKVNKSVEETSVVQSSVTTDARFMSVLQGIMLTGDKRSDGETEATDEGHIQTENLNVVKEVKETMEKTENKNDTMSDAEIEAVNVTVMGKDNKPLVDNRDKEEQNDSTDKVAKDIDSADTQVKQTSLASPDIAVVDASKCHSNLEIFLNRGHPPDPSDPPPVEGINPTVSGQPTLLSLANQLTAILVKGIDPESDLTPASLHVTPPPTDSPHAQSSPLATEIPTEETRQNGHLSSSLKSTTQESENHNRTGCDAEVDIEVIPGGNDTRPRSPSSIPSPAMMHSKRALEGVCELDEDRQSSDSYPVTPRTDSPSSMSSHCSRGQQSNRSTNLLTPFSVSTESMMSYYSDAGEGNYGKIPVTGEIQFGLDYNYKNSVFEVAIRQCKDVAAVDTKKKRSDPYVKTYLLPDRTKNGKRKTRVKKHTLNPVFDEILKYHVTKSELETRTLWVTVWHNDTFGRNDFLGEVTLPLDYYEFGDSSAQWYKLQERPKPAEDEYGNPLPLSLLTYKGDLNLSLRFVSPENLPGRKKDGRCGSNGSLHVLIKQARNLTAVRANGSSDPFCKGYLLPDKIRRIKQKTPVLKKNCNPTWNHTMVFENVSWDELRDYCLELTIWDFDRFTSNDFLGGVRLNLGSGKSGGKEVDWMDAKGDEISIWQAMLDRPNYWIDGTLMVRPNMDRRK